ncbi:MAG: hypothetical protein Q7R81_07730 [Candidatus Peregrinibacteria bacterium]|nr:hypothetical protein [Candidatus Peregrinibacteria bacterium]
MEISPPLNPKDYPTYAEYQAALQLREDFLNKAKAVDDLLQSTKTEEEYREGMKKLGFTYHEDEICEREWCRERETCIMIELECLQDLYNRTFFADLLAVRDYLITRKEMGSSLCGAGCTVLPVSWSTKSSRERSVLEWFFDFSDALAFENVRGLRFAELSGVPDMNTVGQSVYLFVLHALRYGIWRQESRGLKTIGKFLKSNDVLSSKRSAQLSDAFKRAQGLFQA